MITVRLLGGAKRSFGAESVRVDGDEMTVGELLGRLAGMAADLDAANVLVAINGADSSASGGQSAVVRAGDDVALVPVIHGGAGARRIRFLLGRYAAEAFPVAHDGRRDDVAYLDGLRREFPGAALQALSRRFVLGSSHVRKVLLVSVRAKSGGTMLSRRIETDLLMRFAGTGQIDRAISTVGVGGKGDAAGLLLVAVAGRPAGVLDALRARLRPDLDPVPFRDDNSGFIMGRFGISAEQVRAVRSRAPLEDLLAERAAVLF